MMYALWKTQGARIKPWRADVTFGAVREGNDIVIALKSDEPWQGRLIFDIPRHREIMHLPMDYPRINQYPEWFTVESNATYRVTRDRKSEDISGASLRNGLDVALEPGKPQAIRLALSPR
jgi:hypothetical protein